MHFPGVERIALFFNDLTALAPEDYITIYKDETHTSYWGNEKQIKGGGPWPGAGGRDPLIIPVSSFVLYFHSYQGEATTKWGFELIAKVCSTVLEVTTKGLGSPVTCFSEPAASRNKALKKCMHQRPG